MFMNFSWQVWILLAITIAVFYMLQKSCAYAQLTIGESHISNVILLVVCAFFMNLYQVVYD
jgi:hypothetical protein